MLATDLPHTSDLGIVAGVRDPSLESVIRFFDVFSSQR